MSEQQEKKNRAIALLSTIGLHATLLVLMFFIVAWRPPNPPFPESGIELNLGFDDQGSGDIQPTEPVGTPDTKSPTEEVKPEPQPEEKTEEIKETAKPAETKPVEEEEILSSKDESPVTVKEKKEEKKPVEKPVEVIKKEEPKKEEPRKEEPKAVFKPTTSASTTTSDKTSTGDGREGKPGSQGDDKDKVGDKGNPQGTPDAKAYYGKPGGGGGGSGPSLELSGWQWDEKPAPAVANNDSGRIVFEIKVDDNGDIISIKTLERSVSTESEQACRKEIQKLTFTKIGSNVPSVSTGKITFVIRSR